MNAHEPYKNWLPASDNSQDETSNLMPPGGQCKYNILWLNFLRFSFASIVLSFKLYCEFHSYIFEKRGYVKL